MTILHETENLAPNSSPEEAEWYNDFFRSEAQAQLAHMLIKLLQGYAPDKIPPFPGDRKPSTIPPGTGLFAQVKQAVTVEELAGRFTRLQYAGPDRLKGKCPLHEERTPSFYVFQSSTTWRCFGACARGGDVIELARLLMDAGVLT